jgi:small-conductance mechanosensitive channel
MKWVKDMSNILGDNIGIEQTIVYYFIISIIIIIVLNLIKFLFNNLTSSKFKDSKLKYKYNKTSNLVFNIIIFILILLVWEEYLKSILTYLSFFSAGVAIASRELIINFFAGIYIKFNKPFILEDRIETDEIKGDVVNINALSFDVLEISNRVNGEQSTGRIVHVPNSYVFNHPVINYVRGFKYIWNEMKLKITLDSDIVMAKKILYEIIDKNIKEDIIEKMENQVEDASKDYRIYFNKLEPIIYTSINDGCIEMYLRFLVHPRKYRNIENNIWCDIIKEFKNNKNINLV